jgi:ABC-type uncharacterized transport system ATPase subunit
MAVHSEVQLKVNDLNMAFGGVQALFRVSLEVKKGEILSIIGPKALSINNIYIFCVFRGRMI